MRAFRIVASVLFVLCIPLALVTTTIRYVVNEPAIYRYAIDNFDGEVTTGLDREQLLAAGAEIRRYFNNDEETLVIRVQLNDREVSLFNPRETVHMEDVKRRFAMMNRAQEFSFLYILVYTAAVVLWAREITMRRLAVQVAIGSALVLLAVAGAGAIGLAGFDSAWEGFHQLLFSNDFWRLNPQTDRLIQMFPPDFWQSIVFLIGLLVAAEAALLLIAAGIYVGASRHASQRELSPRYA